MSTLAAVKSRLFRPKRDVDMTEGSIARHIIVFAIPLLIGNLFQQLYNMVDTWVVGNYVGSAVFAAVGSVGPIINVLIGFFLGFSSGASVVISQYYGAKQEEKVSQTVHTILVVTLILGVVFTFVGIGFTPLMLELMQTDPNVQPQSEAYLKIYFAGVIGLMIYNVASGILRAVGDSQRPFYFLCASAVINTVLDLVFVLCFDMGVEGVAYATIIAQGVSAILCIITLMRTKACIRLSLRELRIHWDMLGKIVRVGFPAALQMTITSFSNVFVQSYINVFGEAYMAGWTAYSKVDQLLFLPMQSIALASTTFVGQNLGKNLPERARRGSDLSLAIAAASTALLMIPILIFAPSVVYFFNKDTAVVEIGTILLRQITPFYILCTVNQVYSGALRGAGNSRAPMVIMLCSFVAFRQIYLFAASRLFPGNFLAIAYGYPAGWLLCSAATFIYYRRTKLTKTRLVEDELS